MVHIREYLFSVTAGALLCGILKALVGDKGTQAGLLRLLCGIFLALTVIRPLGELDLQDVTVYPEAVLEDAKAAAEEGTDYAQRAMARHIKEKSEAYILDKATRLGARITPEVTVAGEGPVPVSCTLRGTCTAYVREQLSRILEADLGIRREDQHWISENN